MRTVLGRRSVLASVGRSLCWSNGVVNGIVASVGQSHERYQRRDVGNSVDLLSSGRGLIGIGELVCWQRWSNGVTNGVGTSIGRRCGRERRRDAGDSMGRLASGRGSIGVGVLVGLTEFTERCRGRRRDLGWLEPRTQNDVRTSATAWDDCRWDVGISALGHQLGWGVCGLISAGASVGLGSLGRARRRAVRLVLSAIAWVERRQEIGLDISRRQRHGSIGSGLWWSDTAWVSRSEYQRTASVD